MRGDKPLEVRLCDIGARRTCNCAAQAHSAVMAKSPVRLLDVGSRNPVRGVGSGTFPTGMIEIAANEQDALAPAFRRNDGQNLRLPGAASSGRYQASMPCAQSRLARRPDRLILSPAAPARGWTASGSTWHHPSSKTYKSPGSLDRPKRSLYRPEYPLQH
jgi:hypothetical protein